MQIFITVLIAPASPAWTQEESIIIHNCPLSCRVVISVWVV